MTHVRQVLQILLQHHLCAKKCEFHQSSITFLGYVISNKGVKIDSSKVSAVTEWPEPSSIKETQRFQGFANFYWQFVRNYSSLADLLNALLKGKPKKLQWSETAAQAFKELKCCFTTAPILHHPDPECPFMVEVDANKLFPCAFLLRTLSLESHITMGATCTQVRTPRWLPAGLSVPQSPFTHVAEDFVTDRPSLNRFLVILVAVDHFFKGYSSHWKDSPQPWRLPQPSSNMRFRQHLQANRRRHPHPPYQPGQMVWLSDKHLCLKLPCHRMRPRYIGLFKVLQQINPVTYHLKLPPSYCISPSYHTFLFCNNINHCFQYSAEAPLTQVLTLLGSTLPAVQTFKHTEATPLMWSIICVLSPCTEPWIYFCSITWFIKYPFSAHASHQSLITVAF